MAVGKSWCAEQLEPEYQRFSLARKLKALAYELYGVQGKADWERKTLQELGADLRKHDKDVFIKYLLNQIRFEGKKHKVVVDDLRFVNESVYFRENGFILVLVTADEQIRQERLASLYPGTDPSRQKHQSEVEWQEIEPDFIIDSSGPTAKIQLERMITDVTYRPSWEK